MRTPHIEERKGGAGRPLNDVSVAARTTKEKREEEEENHHLRTRNYESRSLLTTQYDTRTMRVSVEHKQLPPEAKLDSPRLGEPSLEPNSKNP